MKNFKWHDSFMSIEPVYAKFGDILRTCRQGRHMSQVELAEEVGISRSSLSNIEAGRQRVYLDQCFKFASALNLATIDSLLPSLDVVRGETPITSKPNISSSQGLTDEELKSLEQAYNV